MGTSARSPSDERWVWTIGHSNAQPERLVELLRSAGIAQLFDVRSYPYSRVAPQFNRDTLQATLRKAGIHYTFGGDALGGRPNEVECYDEQGHVLYGRLAALPRFQRGIDKLLSAAARHSVAMLCSEESPSNCHRHLLIARVLHARKANVLHLRHNRMTQPYESMPDVRRTRAIRS
jgi:uncharacterized protein (DUF488 family)